MAEGKGHSSKIKHRAGDNRELHDHDDMQFDSDLENPGQRPGMSDLQAAPENKDSDLQAEPDSKGSKYKGNQGKSSGLDISNLFDQMQQNNTRLIANLMSDFGKKMETKMKGWLGKSVPTATVSKPPSDMASDVDSIPPSGQAGNLSEGEVESDEGDQNSNRDYWSDSDNRKAYLHEDDIVSLNPRDTDSFLGDATEADFLPKESRRAIARKMLFTAAGATTPDAEDDDDKENSKENPMLKKFLESIPKKSQSRKVPSGTAKFKEVFGEAPLFGTKKKDPEFDLDEEQIGIIAKYWRSERPHKLAGYSEESYKILKVKEKFVDLTSVPTLDKFVKHVNHADQSSTKQGYKAKMWESFETELRKAHKGARVGMLSVAMGQQILYNSLELLKQWQADSVINDTQFEAMKQMFVANFEASNRSLEQCARVGGLIQQTRRHVVLEDLGIPKSRRETWLQLPLSGNGIMGSKFEEDLSERAQMRKQFKASATQLGIMSSGMNKSLKRSSKTTYPPAKRNNPHGSGSYHSAGDHFQRGRSNFRGRAPFPRGRGARGRGMSWNAHSQANRNASSGPPGHGKQQ